MSSRAKMFEGSAVARISVDPARFTGSTVVLRRDLFGHEFDHRTIDLELLEVDRGNAVLFGDEVGQLVLVEKSELGNLGAEACPAPLRLRPGVPQLVRGQEVFLDQELADPLVHRNPPVPPRSRSGFAASFGMRPRRGKPARSRRNIGPREGELYRCDGWKRRRPGLRTRRRARRDVSAVRGAPRRRSRSS